MLLNFVKLTGLWLSIIRGKFSPFPWSAEVQNRQSSLASWWDWSRSVLFQVHCYAEEWLFDMSALWPKTADPEDEIPLLGSSTQDKGLGGEAE